MRLPGSPRNRQDTATANSVVPFSPRRKYEYRRLCCGGRCSSGNRIRHSHDILRHAQIGGVDQAAVDLHRAALLARGCLHRRQHAARIGDFFFAGTEGLIRRRDLRWVYHHAPGKTHGRVTLGRRQKARGILDVAERAVQRPQSVRA